MSWQQTEEEIARAADAIRSADAMLIGAGAGMGVDSGLPDFRGNQGFWKAYPPFRGMRFAEVSNPVWFGRDPEQAWGFFGHRLHLYRETAPHVGFDMLRGWAESMTSGYFVFTSNVDGHFHQAGFEAERILECHGSIHYLQCSERCSDDIWPADDCEVKVDEETIRATSTLPSCIHCTAVARPNILMFGDYSWNSRRHDEQQRRYVDWLDRVREQRLVIIEFGAGTSVPTVRMECQQQEGELIRVNPRDHDVPAGAISIPWGALAAIEDIDELL